MKPTQKIGLLHSLTGFMASTENQIVEAEFQIIEQINKQGGILNHWIEPIIEDCNSSAEIFTEKTLRLLDAGIGTFFGCYNSVERKAIRPLIEDSNAILFYSAPYEGFEESKHIVYTGLTLNQLITPLVTWIRTSKYKRIYHIGTNMVYQIVLSRMLRLICDQHKIKLVGESFLNQRINTNQAYSIVSELYDTIEQGEVDLLLLSLVGQDSTIFNDLFSKKCKEANQNRNFHIISTNGQLYQCQNTETFVLTSNPVNPTENSKLSAERSFFFWKTAVERASSFEFSKLQPHLKGLTFSQPHDKAILNANQHTMMTSAIVKTNTKKPVLSYKKRIEPKPWLGLENQKFTLQALSKEAMAGFADSIHFSLLLERKNERQKRTEQELKSYRNELEDRIKERSASLEDALQAIEKQIQQKTVLKEALDKSEHRFHQVLEQTSLIAVMLNTQGEIIYSNPALSQKTGWPSDEIKDKNWYELFVPQKPYLTSRYKKAITENRIKPKLEQEIITRENQKLFIRWTNTILKAEQSQIIGIVSLGEDTTEQRLAQEALRTSENKLRTLFYSMTDIILVVDTNGQILEVAPTASVHTIPPHLAGSYLKDLLTQEQTDFFLSAIRRTLQKKQPVTIEFSYHIRKEEHWFEGRLSSLAENSVLIIIRDETERVFAQKALYASNIDLERRVIERTTELQTANAQLRDLATRDELTGIANRRLFNETIESEIRRAQREKRSLSLILCDVDYFKKYNDYYGHQAGDDCLRLIGAVMTRVFRRAGDLPARYGGEEFAVILPGSDSFQALLMAERLRSEVEQLKVKHAPNSGSQYITLSLGISSLSSIANNGPLLIEAADKALYDSKSTGRNQITVAPAQ